MEIPNGLTCSWLTCSCKTAEQGVDCYFSGLQGRLLA